MRPLRLRIRPHEGESLSGVIVRSAERARLGSALENAAMAGLRLPGSAVSNDDLTPLAFLTGIPSDRLDAMAYRPVDGGRHRYLGSAIDRDLIALRPRRVCPVCLKETGFHRMEWDFAPATACLRHHCRLETSCPVCGRRFGWEHPSLTECPCGASITALLPRIIPDAVVSALSDLYAITSGASLPWIPPELTDCTPSDLLKATLMIGMVVTGWNGRHRVASMVAAGVEAVDAIMVAGANGLHRWPASLEEIRRTGIRPPWVWAGSAPYLLHLRRAAG
ncbi:hypothetical protein CRT60_06560 [Azospirillum palustre]|uniref:TniQ domain-containing protein n=1 Tax=Azospirillum palustre TaxID=2044885 RepID=A0A2B8BIR3_9PROT|nr:TniQ family protein [Azospirillum palustre]PGH57650.1 hypothetical protein CRT60_06560 [Azospirillum palustre]